MEKSGFFNSSGGDRVYDASDFASYFGKLVSNGIFYGNASNLQVQVGDGMSVNVLAGSAWINGYVYENTEPLMLELSIADGVNPRIDRVVIRWSAIDREIKLAVLTGMAVASPVAPDLTRNNDVYELGIAEIHIPQGAISIPTQNIIDTRLDPSLCGTVNSLVTAVYE